MFLLTMFEIYLLGRTQLTPYGLDKTDNTDVTYGVS